VNLLQQKHDHGMIVYSFKRREVVTSLNCYELVLRMLDVVTMQHAHTVLDIPYYETDWRQDVLSGVNTVTIVCEMNLPSIKHAMDLLDTIRDLPGGKKPVQFNMNFSRTQQFQASFGGRRGIEVDRSRQFSITGLTVGMAKRVQWPDDFFTISHSLSYQLYDFRDFNIGLFNFGNGKANSLAYTFGLSRNALLGGRIFPRGGSNFEITAKMTPPYSLLNNKDFAGLKETSEALTEKRDSGQGLTLAESQELERVDGERFRWLEYYKAKFRGDWYTSLVGDLVLRTNAEFGFLGNYNSAVGDVPFERFFVGGDGLANFVMDGREIIQLRGYENQSITPVDGRGQPVGGLLYNKFSMELRYPLTLKPSASIYGLAFLEGGNTFNNFQSFNPFQLKRSAGMGIRIFMPAFGLLGIDFGYGFDEDLRPQSQGRGPSGWQTHFIIGQQF
jgi:outer membrane protein insertion porin family